MTEISSVQPRPTRLIVRWVLGALWNLTGYGAFWFGVFHMPRLQGWRDFAWTPLFTIAVIGGWRVKRWPIVKEITWMAACLGFLALSVVPG